MRAVNSSMQVTMSGLDKLMPDVDTQRVFESRLVHQLDGRKVAYCTHSGLLYFWEPENGQLRQTMELALRSLGRRYVDRPVQMDNLGCFTQPRKLYLNSEELQVVGTALRLIGVKILTTTNGVFAE